jgi:hypothetical protein
MLIALLLRNLIGFSYKTYERKINKLDGAKIFKSFFSTKPFILFY